jgi:hypothetical protein
MKALRLGGHPTPNIPSKSLHLLRQHYDRTQSSLVWRVPLLAALFLLLVLSGCSPSGDAISNVRVSSDTIVPGSSGIGKPAGFVQVSYTLGPACGNTCDVTATLDGPVKAVLLSDSQKAGDHIVRFNGTVDQDTALPGSGSMLVRSVAPAGDYTITIASGAASESVGFKVAAVESVPPSLQNVVVHPSTISPNQDAIDDVAELTFRTNMTATLSANLFDNSGDKTSMLAPTKKGPGEQNVVINGKDALGNTLPDGVYTATVRADDALGNRVEASTPITITAGGEPSIALLSVDFTPTQIIAGSLITVTIKVKNTGNVPLRTQGPDPGYTYTTNDSYSSLEGGKWVDKAGLWRAGVDWDGNSGGGGPYRYPFRWGFGKTLMPGEEVTTGGTIRILKQEHTMWFFAGVLQEGVRIVLDRRGRTAIGVDF